jgi:hypothetical protein
MTDFSSGSVFKREIVLGQRKALAHQFRIVFSVVSLVCKGQVFSLYQKFHTVELAGKLFRRPRKPNNSASEDEIFCSALFIW